MKRLLSLAAPIVVLAGAGYWAWQRFGARPARNVPVLPSDELLSQRVRVSVERSGAVPAALHLRVVDGTVVLSGAISAAERDRILRAILAVPGIRGVRNRLDVQGARADPDLAVESQPWEPSARPR